MFPRLLVQFSVGIFIEEGHVNPLMGMQTILKAMKGFWFWFAKNNSRQPKNWHHQTTNQVTQRVQVAPFLGWDIQKYRYIGLYKPCL